MKLKSALAIVLSFPLWLSCVHDPFPVPPDEIGPCESGTVYFEKDILPILSANCAYSGCHDAGTARDGVVLDSYQNTFDTGDIEPGNPGGSELYEVITESDPSKIMPPQPNTALTQEQINLIALWISQGAENLDCIEDCDTVNVSFLSDIKPVFDSYCFNCHSGSSPSGGLLLTDYATISDASLNGEVVPRINHENGLPIMPPSGTKIDDCNLSLIDAWVRAGAPNN